MLMLMAGARQRQRLRLVQRLANVFLPAGFPASVSEDYVGCVCSTVWRAPEGGSHAA